MKKVKAVGAFSTGSFVRASVPTASLAVSPAQAQRGTLSIVRTIQGNFAAGPFDHTLTIPRGYLFFPHSVGLVLAYAEDVGALGEVQFGVPPDPDFYLPATAVTLTDAWANEEWFVRDELKRNAGVTRLSAGLATSGILTQALGYFYFVGLMVKS